LSAREVSSGFEPL